MKSRLAILTIVLVTLILFQVAGTTRAEMVFFDDFQDRPSVPAEVPVIETSATGALGDLPDVGISWNSENNNVDVVADPAGVADSQVLQGNFTGSGDNGNMDGDLAEPIRFDGAKVTFDFYLGPDGNAANDATVRIRPVDGAGTGGLQFNVDGSVSGAGNAWTLSHFGTEIWQTAEWTYASTGNLDEYEAALTVTERGTANSVAETITFTAAEGTDTNVFTEANVLFRGNSNHTAYVDNLSVEGTVVPEPGACVLALIGLVGVGWLGRRQATFLKR